MVAMIAELMALFPFLDTHLVHATLRVCAVAALVGLGLMVFQARSPHVQLTAWKAVLLVALAMPLLMSVMVFNVPVETVSSTSAAAMVDAAMPPFGEASVGTPVVAQAVAFDWQALVPWIYATVAAVLLLRLAIGVGLALRLKAGAERVVVPWAEGQDVRASEALNGPVTVGSTILLPADYEIWSEETLQAVLAHERAHVARGDFYVQILAVFHRAVFWFNPLSWWLSDKLATLAELSSDAEAVVDAERRAAYAAILLDLAKAPQAHLGLAPMAIAMARPATVRERVERLLAGTSPTLAATRTARLAVGIAVAVLALPAAICIVKVPVASANQSRIFSHPEPLALEITRDTDREVHASRDAIAREAMVAPAHERQRAAAETSRTAGAMARQAVTAALVERRHELPQSVSLQRETRDIGAFHSVKFAGVGELNITAGLNISLVLEGDAELLKNVRTVVRNGSLVIEQDRAGWSRRGPLTVHLTMPVLKAAQVAGSGLLRLKGLTGGETAVSLSGSGTVEGQGELDSLNLAISGSGKANLAGLSAKDVNVSISGSGDATLQATHSLRVAVSGSGRVRYIGKPNEISTDISGSGSVREQERL